MTTLSQCMQYIQMLEHRKHQMFIEANRWRVGIQVLATMYQYIAAGLLLFHYHVIGVGIFALVAAVCAHIALAGNGKIIWPIRMFLFLPQQFSLLFVLFFRLWQSFHGMYQSEHLLLILLCAMYTIAIAHDVFLRFATHTLRAK